MLSRRRLTVASPGSERVDGIWTSFRRMAYAMVPYANVVQMRLPNKRLLLSRVEGGRLAAPTRRDQVAAQENRETLESRGHLIADNWIQARSASSCS